MIAEEGLRAGRAWAIVAAIALAGCGDGAAREAPVLLRSDPASAAECPSGGAVVSSGVDDNQDGLLQEEEVAVRTPVCDPAPVAPPVIVLRVAPEPPGPNCSAGGTAVAAGPDLDLNGVLDDTEVTHTDYVCRQALVTRIVTEPPGASCSEGGVGFLVGIDDDRDGVLDDNEVERTELTCGDVIARDVVIRSDAEAAVLAPIRVITGSVTVQLTDLRSLSLPRLEWIGGSLAVLHNGRLSRLALPALLAVDGDITLRANGLTDVDCSKLRRAASLDIQLLAVTRLTGFAALAEVAGAVRINDMPALIAADLPPASRVGDLSITANPALVHVTWDVTDRLGRVEIRDNPRLETIDLSMAVLAGGAARVGAVTVTANPALGHLGLRAEEVESFTIGDQPMLTDLQLPVTRFDRDVTIVDVAAPLSLAMRGHFGHMEIGGNLTISGPVVTFEAGDGISVDGEFVLDGTRLQRIARFERSLRVGQRLRVSNNARLIDLSSFSLIGDLEVTGNAVLASVNIGTVFGDEIGAITIADNPQLSGAPGIAHVSRIHGGLIIEGNPRLVELFGPELARIEGAVRVHDNARLADLQLLGLELVGTSFEVSSNAMLLTLALPALPEVAGTLTIDGNAQLRHLDLASLVHSDNFGVHDNPRLPTCAVVAVFSHTTGAQQQSGNDDGATCDL